MTIMYVDDDREDRELFSEAVQQVSPDIACLMATNGVDALDQLQSVQAPDFIFLDINMPVMDGKECLRQLKLNPNLASIPVVMYSTSSNERDIKECIDLGADEFVVKPYNFRSLCDCIVSVIGPQKVLR